MIDTHCHLDSSEFDIDRNQVIQDAFADGITLLISPATSKNNIEKVLSIARLYKNILCAVGIHPHYADEYNEEVEVYLEELIKANNDKIVAIGEIGLDYHYNFASKEVQMEAFARQLRLANRLSLPAIVHNRKADSDLLNIIKENGKAGEVVLHCFSGDTSFLAESLTLGCFVSFTGNITFKNSLLTDVVKNVPEDRFFLETDSPYLAPVPFRGKRNQPKFVKFIAQKISEIKQKSIDEVINMTTKNALKFFKLSMAGVLCLFFSLFQSISNPSGKEKQLLEFFSLSNKITLQDQDFVSDFEEEKNPYLKFIGIGPTFGFNTIVVFESWKNETGATEERNSAYEGKYCWGGNLSFSPFDFMITRLEFIYTKDLHEFWQDNVKYYYTNIYRILSLSSLFIPNPKQRVNFFAGAGFTYMFNSMNLSTDHPTLRHRYGINGSIGFIFNLPIQKIGLFTLTGEWLLLFDFQKDKGVWEPVNQRFIDTYYYYSLPRFSINWYPSFLF
ncbi:MAG: TatD family hydrolase [Candidatus Kapaibacteriales bacterium]